MSDAHPPSGPLRLAELDSVVARTVLSRVPRLLVPVGAMVSRGPTVPLGADSVIVDRVADDLSERLGVVRSPVVPFGVHARSDPETPGSASLTRKTLHRLMNELIAAWETEAKIREFVFLTTHSADAHLEALSTIRSTCSVRLIDLFQGLESTPPDTRPIEIPLLAWLTPALVPNATAAEHADGERIYQAILARLVSQLESWSH